jgi:hypothetical protein
MGALQFLSRRLQIASSARKTHEDSSMDSFHSPRQLVVSETILTTCEVVDEVTQSVPPRPDRARHHAIAHQHTRRVSRTVTIKKETAVYGQVNLTPGRN